MMSGGNIEHKCNILCPSEALLWQVQRPGHQQLTQCYLRRSQWQAAWHRKVASWIMTRCAMILHISSLSGCIDSSRRLQQCPTQVLHDKGCQQSTGRFSTKQSM